MRLNWNTIVKAWLARHTVNLIFLRFLSLTFNIPFSMILFSGTISVIILLFPSFLVIFQFFIFEAHSFEFDVFFVSVQICWVDHCKEKLILDLGCNFDLLWYLLILSMSVSILKFRSILMVFLVIKTIINLLFLDQVSHAKSTLLLLRILNWKVRLFNKFIFIVEIIELAFCEIWGRVA